MKLLPRVLTALSATALSSTVAYADFRSHANPSAAASGRGGGNTILNDDSSALFTNPAKLARLESAELRFDPALFISSTDYNTVAGSDSSGTLTNFGGSASMALPFERGVFGIGISTIYGLAAELPRNGALRGIEPYQLELLAPQLSAGLALPLTDALSLGATLDLVYGDLTYRQIYSWSTATGLPLPDGTLGFDADGWGVGASAGLTYQIDDRQEIGLRFKAPITVDLDGDFSLSGNPGIPGTSATSDFSTEFQLPAEIALGYGVQINDRLRAGADVMWLGWSDFNQTVIEAGNNNGLLPDRHLDRSWQDTWHAGFGLDYAVSENWTLRAGYQFTEGAVPNRTFTPTLPDSDRHQVSVGIGWESGNHAIDLGYSHSFFKDRNVSNNQNPLLNGEYELELGIVQLGYRLRF